MKKIKLEFLILKHEHFYKDTVHLGIRLRFFDFQLRIRMPILFYNEIIKWNRKMEDGWQPYTGKYTKDEYYVRTKEGEIFGPCWPNAGMFHLLDGSCVIDGCNVTEVKKLYKIP